MNTKTPISELADLVKIYDDAGAEIEALKATKLQLETELKNVIGSGEINDSKLIARASDISIRLRMLPFRVEKLEALRAECVQKATVIAQSAAADLNAHLARLKGCFARDFGTAAAQAARELVEKLAPNQADWAAELAEEISDRSLLGHELAGFDFAGNQYWANLSSARFFIHCHRRLEQLERVFFKGGSINLSAVSKVTELQPVVV